MSGNTPLAQVYLHFQRKISIARCRMALECCGSTEEAIDYLAATNGDVTGLLWRRIQDMQKQINELQEKVKDR